jgi:hypothetical protein
VVLQKSILPLQDSIEAVSHGNFSLREKLNSKDGVKTVFFLKKNGFCSI